MSTALTSLESWTGIGSEGVDGRDGEGSGGVGWGVDGWVDVDGGMGVEWIGMEQWMWV